MLQELTISDVKSMFKSAGLDTPTNTEKINVGFSNDIFSVDSTFILKSAKSEGNNTYLDREIYLCNLLKAKLPIPKIIYSDTSKQLIDRNFIIYEKVQGDNLYRKWHEYDDNDRKAIVKDICTFLKAINDTSYEDYAVKFGIDTSLSCLDKVMMKAGSYLTEIKSNRLLEDDLIVCIETYIKQNKDILKDEKIALTYYDPHFDNFIVKDKKIVAMLDFERTDVFSIDYVLDLVNRMETEPKKYASETSKRLIVPEDYAGLMDWYREYYPELFSFKAMDIRIALYSIIHDLRERVEFKSEASKQRLIKLVG
jgi:aminoglycoside phosphotransferase (APT) family kinase protein